MALNLLTFPDARTLARAAAGEWLDRLAVAQGKNASNIPYTVALSGGRIAKDFFEELVAQSRDNPKFQTHPVFWNVHFFWADERCVPPDDAESNFKTARELLFEPLKIPASQIHRLKGELDPSLAVKEAVEDIGSVAPSRKGQPVLDMVFLGMGEDGHVASLFPGEAAGVMESPEIYRSVVAVKPPPKRLTVGYGVLASAEAVWVLASGKGKEQALKESLSPTGKTPLARVLQSRSRGETRVYTDIPGVTAG